MSVERSELILADDFTFLSLPLSFSLIPLKICQDLILDLNESLGKNWKTYHQIELTSDIKTLQSSLYHIVYDALSLPDCEDYLNYSLVILEKTIIFLSSLIAISVNFFYLLVSEAEQTIAYYFSIEHTLEIKEHKKPDNILVGTATCTYQDTGTFENSQWARWQETIGLPQENRSHHSGNLFTLYRENPGAVIARLKTLGVNSYRFSIEWSQIQPEEKDYDLDAMSVYKRLAQLLKAEGIEPMVTFHHFSEPLWFHDSGSFNNDENCHKFADFCEFVTREMKDNVNLFCTINEPNIEAFSRYVRGAFSPGNIFQFHKGLKFLIQALKAHNLAYDKVKAIKPAALVGFSHQYLRFIGANSITTLVADVLSRFVNEVTLKALETDEIVFSLPFHHPFATKIDKIKTDFIGVQYYTRPILGFIGSIGATSTSPMTLMPFREDPEGLKEAILTVHMASKKPIIVTENGVSTENPEQRARYFKKALNAFMEAKEQIGKDLLGYYQWAFTRNFEWDMGMRPQNFGAFNLIEQGERMAIAEHPKEGMEPFIAFAKS